MACLVNHHGTFWFQIAVPAPLVGRYGKLIRQNLQTGDRATAQLIAYQLASHWLGRFAADKFGAQDVPQHDPSQLPAQPVAGIPGAVYPPMAMVPPVVPQQPGMPVTPAVPQQVVERRVVGIYRLLQPVRKRLSIRPVVCPSGTMGKCVRRRWPKGQWHDGGGQIPLPGANGVQVAGDANQTGIGHDLFGGYAAGVFISGFHPAHYWNSIVAE